MRMDPLAIVLAFAKTEPITHADGGWPYCLYCGGMMTWESVFEIDHEETCPWWQARLRLDAWKKANA